MTAPDLQTAADREWSAAVNLHMRTRNLPEALGWIAREI
jgi:hypothetical protein